MTDDPLKAVIGRRAELARWQSSGEFATKVEELARLVDSEKLFNNPAAQFLLDAIPIAEFTKFRPVEFVRLTEQREQRPDGQIGNPKNSIGIEVTEVLEEGRRRGDEYRNGGQAASGNADDWRKRAEAIPGLLEKGIERKINKGNASDCILLVYLNISNFGLLQKETEAAIVNVKARYAKNFREICILWQEKLL